MGIILKITFTHNYSEVNSGFFYKSAEEREKLVAAERAFTDEKVKKIVELKKKVHFSLFLSFIMLKPVN